MLVASAGSAGGAAAAALSRNRGSGGQNLTDADPVVMFSLLGIFMGFWLFIILIKVITEYVTHNWRHPRQD